MSRTITEEEVSDVMDTISYIYDQIKDIRTTCNIIEEAAGEICNLIKCLDKVEEDEYDKAELKKLLKECSMYIDWRTDHYIIAGHDRKQELFDAISEALK